MTLLRRAPREVYRVYGEEEFLAGAGGEERTQAPVPRPGEPRLHRVAGMTMLLAATGAVGGLIAITNLSSVAGTGRRVRTGLLAATGSLVSSRSARAHVWRERAGADGPLHQSVRAEPVDRARVARRAGARPRAVAVILRRPSAPIEAAPPASVARLIARASAGPQQSQQSAEPRRSGQSEFGFER